MPFPRLLLYIKKNRRPGRALRRGRQVLPRAVSRAWLRNSFSA